MLVLFGGGIITGDGVQDPFFQLLEGGQQRLGLPSRDATVE
jgi:hypothetical protein